ncbi:alpha/beta hydrolase [Amycolatopsis sp. CA-128772]|uniref:alpha/beta hydrolase n=1 Tax=Amycolatopsis sp. CA-128772 TaxID=2073159 RepID=UPI000CD0B049|nr:alpha/beta hydrolase [Amycolatopsis sp. CA-128772]
MTGGDPAAVAVTVVGLVGGRRFADVEALFAPRLRAVASAETLRVGWEGEIARIGPVSAIGGPVSEPAQAGLVRVRVPVTCERGGLTVVMSVDDAGLLHGLRLAPPAGATWEPPPYAAPKRFGEREVTVGSGPLAVPGTMTLPKGRGPWPGVVLLGSGPCDRDLTTGPNKPFKDLAWGLASSGVAVVRFDKVTHTHGHAGSEPGFTMAEEYLPHALAAVHLLRQQRTVDAGRVFVLGHSGGGKAAPRVAAADPAVAGVVCLAGDTVPLGQAAVRVVRYLAELDPGPATAAAVESVTRQAALVESPGLSPSTPSADLLFGWPASYWLDLRGYDPVATAAALAKPMLVLQGGRDYQVTVADDLARWRAALARHPDATIRVHDADDHMFFRGEGPSKPSAYESPQHVDPAVVADIAGWLSRAGRCPPARRSS